MIELEPITDKADISQLKKFRDGANEEIKELNKHIESLKSFINDMVYPHTDEFKDIHSNEHMSSTEAASQHIGYLESKIMESIGTIDKIALELAIQIDKAKDDNTTTDNRENSAEE